MSLIKNSNPNVWRAWCKPTQRADDSIVSGWDKSEHRRSKITIAVQGHYARRMSDISGKAWYAISRTWYILLRIQVSKLAKYLSTCLSTTIDHRSVWVSRRRIFSHTVDSLYQVYDWPSSMISTRPCNENTCCLYRAVLVSFSGRKVLMWWGRNDKHGKNSQCSPRGESTVRDNAVS